MSQCHEKQKVTRTCRHQHHGGEVAHLLLAQPQGQELLAELEHGVEELSGAHGAQRLQAVLLAAQESHGAFVHIEQRGKAHHKHLVGGV